MCFRQGPHAALAGLTLLHNTGWPQTPDHLPVSAPQYCDYVCHLYTQPCQGSHNNATLYKLYAACASNLRLFPSQEMASLRFQALRPGDREGMSQDAVEEFHTVLLLTHN